MRLQLLTVCCGIALHSRMSRVPLLLMDNFQSASVLAGVLCVTALMLAFALAHVQAHVRAWPKEKLFARCWVVPALLSYGLLLTAGFCWAMLLAQQQLHQRLPLALEGQDFWAIGQVASLVRGQTDADTAVEAGFGNRRTRQFEFELESACLRLKPELCVADKPLLKGMRVTLSDYGALPIQAGQRWQLRVRVNRPHSFSNPGVYDFEAGQFQRGIMARGYIRETSFNQALPLARWSINSWRAALAAQIDNAGGSSNQQLNHPGLLKALVIGDREGISDQQWALFTSTGTNHLVVISGLHVGFMALCAWTLINGLVRVSPALMLVLPAQQWAAMAAILAALCYSVMAGFSLPTQRAVIMITVFMGSRLLGLAVARADALLLAALLVLLLDPMAVTQAGFWLSFGAVASLFFAFAAHGRYRLHALSWRHRMSSAWQRWVQPQWVVSVGLLLPLIVWTGQVSVISPLANVLAIPLVSLLVVPLALIGSIALLIGVPGADFLLISADKVLVMLLGFLSWLTSWSPGNWRPVMPDFDVMVLMAIASVMLLAPRGLFPRYLALLLLLPLLRPPDPARPAPGIVWVRFLDVGQGLAVAVHTQRHTLLFDTGPTLGPDYDAGKAVLLPYLRWSRVAHLDTVIVSHWHADHSGGLQSLASEIPINTFLSGQGGSADNAAQAPASADHVRNCESGQQWQWDAVEFHVLYPPAVNTLTMAGGNLNNTSCVLMISTRGQRLLLTGDIEQQAEHWMVREWANALRADIVLAPHHGSRSSSTPSFVAAVQPDWVVMSAGYNNRFDHPHPEVVQRYQDADVLVENTAESGAILFELGGDQPRLLERQREQARRFWHTPR